MNNEVFNGNDKQIRNLMDLNQIPDKLYYYTDITAFFNMITNKELWFGNVSSMNDKNEMHEFIGRLEQELLDLYKDNEILKKQISSIFMELDIVYPYVMCCSKYEDNAAQWERYADNARGVCIEIDGFNFLKLLNYGDLFPRAVLYNYPPRQHELFEIINKYLTDKGSKWGSKEIDLDYIKKQILLVATMRKHKSFETEGEIRFSTIWNMEFKYSKKEFKLINNCIKEFVILDLTNYFKNIDYSFDDIFSKVLIGPRSNQSTGILKEFLKSKDERGLVDKVFESGCSLR